eukprot:12602008-Alexandrium_andersonii.AAC.1
MAAKSSWPVRSRLGLQNVTLSSPARVTRRSPRAGNWSRLGWVAVPPQASQAHDTTATWHTNLSDHAGLLVTPTVVVRRAGDCQPR